MNIGEAARQSGVPAKTIRYYEDIGLIAAANRGANGYRDYTESDVELLRFIRHARAVGFGIKECRRLVALYRDPNRHSRDVKALAQAKIAEIDRRIAEFQHMRGELAALAAACPGDDDPECAILEELAGAGD
ncbi:Cu(I)-responsive transcriptional regulator [Dichotomicrobium thermohalophilum]|uniref:MerR family copper efflux transcriptional regulator n=1 Tax=Dichotomicrobium thermohalophilum TaxID=933063 RepID=A0A397Q133_9HYPH|nr:Cu(I)-responsive transcriptional regulator [Dichotomicrobium thermohalophilum]RIA55220.1 MerR family copper efflux transcriptional regulator [Dichotomicrobium thermohalophilum]